MLAESTRDDLLVAVVVALSLVALALGNRFVLGTDPGLAVELSPLYVYLGYLLTRKGGPYAVVDTPRNWALLVVLVTVVAFGYAAT